MASYLILLALALAIFPVAMMTYDQTRNRTSRNLEFDSEKSVANSTRAMAWLTGALVFTGVVSATVSGAQWWEIHSGSRDTHSLAQAAIDQAKAAQSSAATAEQNVAVARDNMIASERAWFGATGAKLEKLELGKPVAVRISLMNSGHEPALKYSMIDAAISITQTQNMSELLSYAAAQSVKCLLKEITTGGVAFPSASYSAKIERDEVDEGVEVVKILLNDPASFVATGCVTYQSQQRIRHSAFCFFGDKNSLSQDGLYFCAQGNDAD